MRRATKETGRTNGVKDDAEPESELDALKRALKDSRGEVMRAQADLETSRLEIQEYKRRSAQQALVASEGLREARRERDDLRGQLEALRYSSENGAKKKKREPDEQDDRLSSLEEELAEARSELAEAKKKLSDAGDEAAALRASAAQLQAALREAQSALEKSRHELEAARASVPPPSAAVVAEEQQPGFFGKLFGRRR